MSEDLNRYAGVDSAKAGAKGRCPRCGEGRLFGGVLSLRRSCEVCGLDYSIFDAADGPAFFVMTLVGFFIVGAALYVEFVHEPPVWLHLVLWPLVAAVLSLPLLRWSKGLMVGLQYRNKAEEGRLVRNDDA